MRTKQATRDYEALIAAFINFKLSIHVFKIQVNFFYLKNIEILSLVFNYQA